MQTDLAVRGNTAELESRLFDEKDWTVTSALDELTERRDIPDVKKLELFTRVLEREEGIRTGTSTEEVKRDHRFYTVGKSLSGIAGLEGIDLEQRFSLVKSALEDEQIAWHGIHALGNLKGFPDSEDPRRYDLLKEIAKGTDSWHRVYALQAMHSIDVDPKVLMADLRNNLIHPQMHHEITAIGKVLLDRDVPPMEVLQYILPAAHREHGDWRNAKVAYLELSAMIAEKMYPSFSIDAESSPVVDIAGTLPPAPQPTIEYREG
jgi:hypothetical protein